MTLSDLTRHLPANMDLSKILASRTERSTSEYVGVLAIGLLAGAAIALLLAPKPGRELRGDISERVGGMTKTAKKAITNGYGEATRAASAS